MDKLFEKYRKRLACIGIFKSIVLARALAFIFVGIISSITWIAKASVTVTIALTVGLGGTAFIGLALLLYFKHFRPTAEKVARQLDALGYDERYITMYECQKDSSTMANLQREDAKKTLVGVSAKLLKFTVALPIVLLLVFGMVFATGTTTASILTVTTTGGKDPEPPPPIEQKEMFTVTYKVYEEGTGTITGEAIQQVEKGHYTQPVTAIPESGYKFVAWVDKDKNHLSDQTNPRSEVNVREDMTIYALFEKKNASGDDKELEGGGGEEGKGPEQSGGTGGSESESGGGEGGQGGGASGGGETQSREDNRVIDGTQDYKDNFDREGLEKELAGSDYPDDLKDILGDYYGTLKP